MKIKLKLILVLSLALGLGACSKKETIVHVPAPKKLEVGESEIQQFIAAGKNQEAANKYVRLGEILLSTEGFTYSDEMFDKALELDEYNDKANFYSAVVKPKMIFKGFFARLRKLATNNQRKHMDKFEKDIKGRNIPEIEEFISQMPKDKSSFNTFEEIRLFMQNEYIPELQKSVLKLEKISMTPFEILFNKSRYGKKKEEWGYSYSCQEYNGQWSCYSYSYSTARSDNYRNEKFKIGPVEISLLKSTVKTQINMTILSSFFSLDNAKEIVSKIKSLDNTNKITDESVVNIINQQHETFMVYDASQFTDFIKNGEEVLQDLLNFTTMQDELCKNTERKLNLVTSFCMSPDDVDDIKQALLLVAGPTMIELGVNKYTGKPVKIVIDMNSFFLNMVTDLKELLPVAFNSKGRAVEFADPTFSGLFPYGDLTFKLKLIK